MYDFPAKAPGDPFPPVEANSLLPEAENIVTSSGQTLSAVDNYQLAKAVANYTASGNYYVAAAAVANTYTATPKTGYQAVHEYQNGAIFRIVVPDANTGPATFNVNGLGAKNIKTLDGTALSGGELPVNAVAALQYFSTPDEFRILYVFNPAAGGAGMVALLDATQTFTNKTLTSPTINTPTINGGTVDGADLDGCTLDSDTVFPIPGNTVQSIVAAAADGSYVDQDVYISPPYDVTVTGLNWTTARAQAVFIRTGTTWRMVFNLTGTVSVAASGITLTIANVVFKNVANYYQACSGACGNITFLYATTQPGTATIQCNVYLAAVTNLFYVSGDVELDAKPTAYLPAGV